MNEGRDWRLWLETRRLTLRPPRDDDLGEVCLLLKEVSREAARAWRDHAFTQLGSVRPSPQLTACLTSAPILASSAAVNSFSAKEVGHMAPSSRFALSLKPNVAYLDLNFCHGAIRLGASRRSSPARRFPRSPCPRAGRGARPPNESRPLEGRVNEHVHGGHARRAPTSRRLAPRRPWLRPMRPGALALVRAVRLLSCRCFHHLGPRPRPHSLIEAYFPY